jgi:hypothetical protein
MSEIKINEAFLIVSSIDGQQDNSTNNHESQDKSGTSHTYNAPL